MSFLLKIVQGPNAGAEIALPEGVTLSVGSSDACDIVFSDAAVGEKAFELEVTQERVAVILPGGKTRKLEPFHVTLAGTTALAVGPAEGPWKELIWPKQEPLQDAAAAEPAGEPEEDAALEVKPETRRSFGWLWLILLLLAVTAGIIWAFRKYPDASKQYVQTGWTWVRETCGGFYQKASGHKSPPPPAETLAEAAAACGFSLTEKEGHAFAAGNFRTRAERLQATARAYAAQPGILLDFADAESLKAAADELLTLVADEDIRVLKVEGRKLFLSGTVSSPGELRRILEAVQTDVPKITETDCSEVTVTGVTVAAAPADESRYRVPRLPSPRQTPHAATVTGPMPIAGILTVPYPCLVLENGSRAMEGARFGAYTIEKIEADAVTVRGEEEVFIWRP